MSSVADIIDGIDQARERSGRVAVGISGFAGAGKSILARRLVDTVEDAVRVRGDDFLDPIRSHQRSRDWDGVQRDRLRTEVLEPFRTGRDLEVRPLDWTTGKLGEPTPLPHASVLLVDAVGILHPALLPWFDVTVWVDVGLEEAQSRGMSRDRAAGLDHDRLWTEVWTPNDHEFEQAFAPSEQADLRYVS